MADADSIPLQIADRRPLGSGEPGWLASIRAGFSALAIPRWAATAALVVLAVGIPVLLWQSSRFGGSKTAPATDSLTAQIQPGTEVPPDSQVAKDLSSDPAAASRSGETAGRASSLARSSAPKPNASADPGGVTASSLAKKESNEQPSAEPSQPAAESLDRRRDLGTLAATTDESKSRARVERQGGAATAPAPVTRESTQESTVLSKIDKERALKLPAEDKHSVSVAELRPGLVDSRPKTERERAATITPRDAEAPRTKDAEGVARGTLAGRTRALLDRDSAKADRARSPQRKVGKKTFWLSKGIWTDSDYDATEDLPIVTVVRASDVYREMLEKKNKLSGFLTGFAEGDRAIIVYKSTVYKLIPHPDSK
jgi:hypothetical protein